MVMLVRVNLGRFCPLGLFLGPVFFIRSPSIWKILENKNFYTDHYAGLVEVKGLWVREDENYFNSAE